jgi:pimeloyl-ACP methyl ester carboxylesterase
MAETLVRVNGVVLCYETFGDPSARPLLLVMGLGAPMIWWDDEFCEALTGGGFFVIRFDNRDTGRSSRMHGRASPAAAYLLRRAPYTLRDMAPTTPRACSARSVSRPLTLPVRRWAG